MCQHTTMAGRMVGRRTSQLKLSWHKTKAIRIGRKVCTLLADTRSCHVYWHSHRDGRVFAVWNAASEEDCGTWRKMCVWWKARERERRPANSCKHFRVCLVLFLFRQRNWTSDYEVDTHCESNKVCGVGPRRAIWMVRVMFFVRSTTVQKWQMYVNFIATETNGKHYLIL